MRKSFFYLPLAALALAACSSDDVVNNTKQIAAVNGDQLQIVPVVTGSTRATSTTTATINEFQVYIDGKFQKAEDNAEQYANMVRKITKSGASWNFPTGVAYWWADKSSTAKFTAVSPAILTDDGETAPTTASITVENAIADQKDYLVAYNEGIREDFEAGVPLNFQHVMSQIVIKALNKSTSDIKVEVAGIKLVNAKSQNTLTFPTKSTANGKFSWDSYTPWTSAATTSATYSNSQDNATVTSGATTLTGTAANLAEPMLLMPQQLVAQDLTATTNLTNNYLAVLVKVSTVAKVAYRDADGYYYTANGTEQGEKINFTTRRDGVTVDATHPADTYTADQIAAINKVAAGEEGVTLPDALKTGSGESEVAATTIYTKEEVLYPRYGFGTAADYYAYVGVALDQEWKPGYKYTYTLNFSKDGIGKSIADLPAGITEAMTNNNFPYGKDFETGEEQKPGEDIIDNPVQLFFTVTVDEWIDADAIDKNM